jgi:hypothetical protein
MTEARWVRESVYNFRDSVRDRHASHGTVGTVECYVRLDLATVGCSKFGTSPPQSKRFSILLHALCLYKHPNTREAFHWFVPANT